MLIAARLKRIRVVHQDDRIAVVEKPANLAVHGGAGEEGPTAIDLLRAACDPPEDLQLVHRLDKATGGLLLLAKSRALASELSAGWDRVVKHYFAVVVGELAEPRRLDAPLPDEAGVVRPAVTYVKPIGRRSDLGAETTLLSVRLETGRTHQIRRHLAQVGLPILFDDRHGDFAANKRLAKNAKAAGLAWPRKSLLLFASRLQVGGDVFRADPSWLEWFAEPGRNLHVDDKDTLA